MPKTTEKQDAPTTAPEVPSAAPQAPTTSSEQLDDDAIRARAYEISQRDDAGSPVENWQRAIAELQAEQQSAGT